jgi:hypothetical protein
MPHAPSRPPSAISCTWSPPDVGGDLEAALAEQQGKLRSWARQDVMREIIVGDVDKRIATSPPGAAGRRSPRTSTSSSSIRPVARSRRATRT